ncbi:MAG: DUF11 domain-containing protein, partial [Solirubrobacteraceae bacterium]|nr:DUF11 domain-containing protein [Solirubrobacteraceae bacterium]
AVDADADGKASPGDTVAYEVTVMNEGAGPATGVKASDTVDANATLLVGSVQAATSATVLQGNAAGDDAVRVDLGSIAAGASASFSYQVTINVMPAGATAIVSSGSVASNEVAPVAPTGPGTSTPVELPDVVPPTIRIVDPIDGATVTAPTMVRADLTPPDGQEISEWCVFAQRVGDGGGERRTVKCEAGAPSGRDLATFDPTVLPNGTYEITVDATADGGGAGYASVTVVVSGSLKPGRYSVSYTDMDLPIQTLPIRVTRSYDSFDKSNGDFGIGWRVGLDGFRVSVNRPMGEGGWASRESNCLFLLGERLCTSTEYEDLRSHVVTVTWPDGKTEAFDFTPTANTGGVVLGGNAGFTGRKATTSKLRAVGDPAITYLADGNIYETDQLTVYNPTRFELTAKDNTRYLLDTKTGLISSTDPHGNTLTVDEDGIRSSLGTSVAFTRDAQGRITRMAGPSGELRTYEYSPAGDLITVTDSLENSVRFEYDGDHNITRTIDPSGRPMRTIEYDAAGRISRITDAGGNAVDLDISGDARQQTATSPDGRLTTISTADERGNVTRVDKVHDGQTRTTRYEFDADDWLLRETNPLGQTTTNTYDANGNRLTTTDAAGNTTRYEYDAANRVVRTTAPDGGVTQVTRDQFGSTTQITDPLGKVQRFEYDARGNQTAQIDALGRVVRSQFDASGNAIAVTDASGATATTTYDASGQLASSAAPGLGTTQLQYDDEGRLKAMVDAAGAATRYSYDALGRRTGVTDQLGRTTVTDYDVLGRKTLTTDRQGVATTFDYDAMSRLVEKVVGGDVTTYGYDGAGRVTSAENADARVTTAFDAADRPTQFSTRISGATTAEAVDYTYDSAGRRASMGYGGVTDSYGYDEMGRLATLTSSQAG